jgi:hypothetical protein
VDFTLFFYIYSFINRSILYCNVNQAIKRKCSPLTLSVEIMSLLLFCLFISDIYL